MNQLVPAGKRTLAEVSAETQDYVTMFIDGQMFGIPVLTVQDVLGPQKVTRIPLAPREVAGSLNLRGPSSRPSTCAAVWASRTAKAKTSPA